MFPVSSCDCLYPIRWSQVLSREWRCSWSSADRRCSNNIWVINNFIAYWSASYIRDLTVGVVTPHGSSLVPTKQVTPAIMVGKQPSTRTWIRNMTVTGTKNRFRQDFSLKLRYDIYWMLKNSETVQMILSSASKLYQKHFVFLHNHFPAKKSDVVGASPVGANQTTSSSSTSMDWAKHMQNETGNI